MHRLGLSFVATTGFLAGQVVLVGSSSSCTVVCGARGVCEDPPAEGCGESAEEVDGLALLQGRGSARQYAESLASAAAPPTVSAVDSAAKADRAKPTAYTEPHEVVSANAPLAEMVVSSTIRSSSSTADPPPSGGHLSAVLQLSQQAATVFHQAARQAEGFRQTIYNGDHPLDITPFIVVGVALAVCCFAMYYACSAAIFVNDRSAQRRAQSKLGGAPWANKCQGSYSTKRLDLQAPYDTRANLAAFHAAMPADTLPSLQTTASLFSSVGSKRPQAPPRVAADIGTGIAPKFRPSHDPGPADFGNQLPQVAERSSFSEFGTLCPALVLPGREGTLEIPVPALLDAEGGGDFPILGPLGKIWGRGSVSRVARARRLELLVARPGGAVLVATVEERRPSLAGGGNAEELEVHAITDGVTATHFARLIRQDDGTFQVRRTAASRPAVVLRGVPKELRLLAEEAGTGRPLASAVRGGQRRSGVTSVEHLEVRLQQGVDTVLLLMSMLGVVLFAQD